jgi:hypothetical protein
MVPTRRSGVTGALLVLCLATLGAGCARGSGPASESTRAHRTIHVRDGRHTFKPGVLVYGDTVFCGSAGAGVPKPGHGVGGAADDTTSSADITVASNADGTVEVRCTTSGG